MLTHRSRSALPGASHGGRRTAAAAATATAAAGERWPRAAAAARSPRAIAAALSCYAGVLHLWVAPEHLDAWWGYGAFFVGVGVLQLALAPALLRWRGPLLTAAGAAANVGVVLVWVWSRTRGIPLGPVHNPHRLEPAGLLDVAAAAAELATAALLIAVLPDRWRGAAVHVALVMGLAVWGLRLTGQLG